MATNGVNKSDSLPIAPTFEEANNIAKEVLEEVVGSSVYLHIESVAWNQSVVEKVTQRLVDMNRPYKYCVTNVIMQTGTSVGLNVSSTCYWDKHTDQTYSIRWESKNVVAIMTVFAISYATKL
uniref:Dynein light chain tctex-type n=1 Tax=Panagrellus redivivus TaxID=6233 RepID=A0A7E4V0S3_PANRE